MAKVKTYKLDDVVRLTAGFKYGYLKAGAEGRVADVYESDRSGDRVYEIEFDTGYTLIFPHDLELVKAADESA